MCIKKAQKKLPPEELTCPLKPDHFKKGTWSSKPSFFSQYVRFPGSMYICKYIYIYIFIFIIYIYILYSTSSTCPHPVHTDSYCIRLSHLWTKRQSQVEVRQCWSWVVATVFVPLDCFGCTLSWFPPSFRDYIGIYLSRKVTWQWKKKTTMNEDISPTKNGDLPLPKNTVLDKHGWFVSLKVSTSGSVEQGLSTSLYPDSLAFCSKGY